MSLLYQTYNVRVCAEREPAKVASCQTLEAFTRAESYRFCKSERVHDNELGYSIQNVCTDLNQRMVHISNVSVAVQPGGGSYV